VQKIRYELDPYNRFIIDDSGAKSGLPKFRKVLEGRFTTDKSNNLSYLIKAPLSDADNIPNQLRLKGEWLLADSHNLRFTVDKSARETFGDQITLQGEILDVGENSLLFAVTTAKKENKLSTYVLNLNGLWKADEHNRLSFHARKEEGKYDILTFDGAWEVDKNHQLVYRYEKAHLITKKRKTHALTFKGYWDIKDKARLSYILGKDSDSVFNFETGAGVFKEDYIQYEVRIGVKDRAMESTKTIKLFGKWNLKKDTGLVFEIEYENKKIKAIVFGADFRFVDNDTLSFRLRNEADNKDMGIDLKLSRKILEGDGEAFLRLLASRRESEIYAGAAWRW
jgi:hypothetical protein